MQEFRTTAKQIVKESKKTYQESADVYKQEIYEKHLSLLNDKLDVILIECSTPVVKRMLKNIKESISISVCKYIEKEKPIEESVIKKNKKKWKNELTEKLGFLLKRSNSEPISEMVT